MGRTKLADRKLPDYTKGEEIFNMVSHITGGTLSVVALVLCVVMAALFGNVWGVVSGSIYGFTLILLYTMSSIYHGLIPERPKKVFQVIDHCAIYFLIAGTYTPILLVRVRDVDPFTGWCLFAVVWLLCALGVTFTAIDLKKYQILSMILYIGMGWCIVFFGPLLMKSLGTGGVVLLFAGGIAYTVGSVLYGIGKKRRFMHGAFHIFVIIGSVLHFFCVLLFVLKLR
ncbi:MAG: hemolysin III family channel protein [Clostridiales bacterium 43-6]|nr:MAG: hemolysin III family channel protein [Clostridiales bacterium 43-6]